MQYFVRSGHAFFLAAALFVIAGVMSERSAVFISLAVVFFVLGLAARKKRIEAAAKDTPND